MIVLPNVVTRKQKLDRNRTGMVRKNFLRSSDRTGTRPGKITQSRKITNVGKLLCLGLTLLLLYANNITNIDADRCAINFYGEMVTDCPEITQFSEVNWTYNSIVCVVPARDQMNISVACASKKWL